MLGNTYETFPANHTRATCTPDTLEASMGLLDSLKSTFTSSGEASVPPAASFATVTNHSIGMITEDGLRVFIHVGLGTVEMNGKGFARFVEMGDTVKAGQPLISFDREAIKAAGHEDIVTVIISELDRLKSIDHVGESGTLIGGNPLVKLGDPLLVAKTK